ncbi:MAG TPA: hypothetical protein VJA16_07665 [Thermoanaerobaculia bacterium]
MPPQVGPPQVISAQVWSSHTVCQPQVAGPQVTGAQVWTPPQRVAPPQVTTSQRVAKVTVGAATSASTAQWAVFAQTWTDSSPTGGVRQLTKAVWQNAMVCGQQAEKCSLIQHWGEKVTWQYRAWVTPPHAAPVRATTSTGLAAQIGPV